MKILHMISGGDSGGAKTHVFALLDALKKYAEVKIICLTPGVFYQEILKKDIDTVLIEQKNRGDLSIITRIADIIENEGFDILHIHGARANFVSSLLKRRIKIPVVSTVHSDYKLDFTEGFYKKYVFTLLNQIALKDMDYYIGVSNNFRNMLIDRGFAPNKIFTVYNGMDFTKPHTFISKKEFLENYNIPYEENTTYIGIIGRFDLVKGHKIFIEGAKYALEKNKNLRFLLAGEGPLISDLKKQAEDYGIKDRVHFVGFLDNIYDFINAIDINTLTSLSESFPYVLLEGAKMKKPTISSNVGGISDLIESGENGFLFENGNCRDFSDKVLKLAESKIMQLKFGENLYNKATTKFSNDNLAKSHIKIYERILKDFYDTKKYDIVMSGYYGFNNSGDDALLTAITDNLRSYKEDVRILTLSKNPKQTRKLFKVDSVNRFNPLSVYKSLKKSKLFLNGGGTLIHDATSSHSLYYYLYLMNLAKKLKLKLVVYANGIGPFKQKNEKISSLVTKKADLITLRDELSLKELRRIGVDNKNVFVTADPAITLNACTEEETLKLMEENNIDPLKKYMAVSVRGWNKNDKLFEAKIAEICDYVYEKYNIETIFITLRPSEDLVISQNILQRMSHKGYIIKTEQSAEKLMGVISKCELVIGMRLHSLIYATTMCVPLIGVIYDPKIKGFLEYIRQDMLIDAENIDSSRLREMIEEILNNKDEIKKNLIAYKEELSKKALSNAEMTINLLEQD